jgi:RHS repeat-associated protein
VPDTVSTSSRSQSWNLDALGNWNNVTTDGDVQTRSHNSANEVTEITQNSDWTDPDYDRAGNTVLMPAPPDPTVSSIDGIYDAWNRLVEVTGPPLRAMYQYDGLGRRIVEGEYSNGTPTETRHLYYSSAWQVVEERTGGTPDTADASRQYVWGLRYVDEMVERDRDTNSDGTLDERLYALQDANFNTTAVCDTSGSAVERYLYDPYGLVKYADSSWSTRTTSSYDWTYLHQGGRLDPNTGLYSFRNRDYSPLLGRWIERDPLGAVVGSNLYLAELVDPVRGLDPSGLYDEAGHFWTTYMTAVAMGYGKQGAYELAYYSQLPDEVPSLNAVYSSGTGSWTGALNFLGGDMGSNRESDWYHDVSELLHSLHGGPGQPRRDCLVKLLASPELKPWQKGMLIHALGDAFAHTDANDKAYGWPIGHALTGNGGHAPDLIGNNFGKYKLYVWTLAGVLSKQPNGGIPWANVRNLNFVFMGARSLPISGNETTLMGTWARSMFGYNFAYDPNDGDHTDPTMFMPTRGDVQSLMDKIRCSCHGK